MYRNLSDKAVENVFARLAGLNLAGSGLSEHTMKYISRYQKESRFFIGAYSQLLETVLQSAPKSKEETVFADYGGGCGILSFIAIEAGFGKVICIDNFETVLNDARKLGQLLGYRIDRYVNGEEKELVSTLPEMLAQTSVICSFDVIEHIYNHEEWIRTVMRDAERVVIFHTSANPYNPFIVRRLKKIHFTAEYIGCADNIRIGNSFSNESFLSERARIIQRNFPQLSGENIMELAECTRGLKEDKILEATAQHINNETISYKPDHETNTCDPYTGNWAERLIDPIRLKAFCEKNNLGINIKGSFYSYSSRPVLNIIKYLLNLIIGLTRGRLLAICPAITVRIEKKNREKI
jgi:hypothetical protein